MFIVTNTIRVPAEHVAHVAQSFCGSDEHMRQVPGCLDFKLLMESTGEGEPIFVAMTSWEDEESFRAWTESEDFQQTHTSSASLALPGEEHRFQVVSGS